MKGTGAGLAGKIKEGLGRAIGDDQLAGAIKDTAGKATQGQARQWTI